MKIMLLQSRNNKAANNIETKMQKANLKQIIGSKVFLCIMRSVALQQHSQKM